ncbi:MAG: class I SAM-dependent methyltransferase, partial [Spirochaetales bacterium]|nr:class I SAM-dependent methyltransferase [Spirochaetales bacterium]
MDTKAWWNSFSDKHYGHTADSLTVIKASPDEGFPREVREMLKKAFSGGFQGKKVLAASSGDNMAAFAFHLLGAEVTSTDISEKQLENASKIADAQGWKINFVLTDTTTLSGIPNASYDLVFTSNGAHIWINSIEKMYQTFYRALVPGGYYVFFEIHPFIHPFISRFNVEFPPRITVEKPYELTGPFHIPNQADEYAWR